MWSAQSNPSKYGLIRTHPAISYCYLIAKIFPEMFNSLIIPRYQYILSSFLEIGNRTALIIKYILSLFRSDGQKIIFLRPKASHSLKGVNGVNLSLKNPDSVK